MSISEYPKLYKPENQKFTFLVVDDSMFMRNQISDILKEMDCLIIGEAENGKDAIEKCEQLKPDFITLDLTMPVMDGLQALQSLREKKFSSKVIVISALGQKEKVLDCIKLGAMEYIVKPFDDGDVAKRIHYVLKKSTAA